jgi:hypothetical protein
MSEAGDTQKDAKARAKADKAYAKASRPWFKKKRFWMLGIIGLVVVFNLAGSGGGDSGSQSNQSSTEEVSEEPAIEVTADKLITDLEENALAAANTYEGKKVIVTGKLSNIDASGDYFSLKGNDDFSFTNVQIFINDSLLDTVSTFKKGQSVTVTGEVTDVGELLGYSIKAISIP